MVPPIGTVYGTDRKGNYKVRSKELEKPTILSGSSMEDLKRGDRVEFEVTSEGDHVYFSNEYKTGTGVPPTDSVRTESKMEEPDLEKSIEMVLLDYVTGDVLVVGNWSNPNFVPHEYDGEICDRKYILTTQKELGVDDAESLAEKIGVGPDIIFADKYQGTYRDSALKFVWAVPGHPDRVAVEKAINDRL